MIIIYKNLLRSFAENVEKQEIISHMSHSKFLHSYTYSELHIIDAIGEIIDPNVTKLSERLNLNRSTVSKITQRLLNNNLVSCYQKEGNKQKVFFRLTKLGETIYNEHKIEHQKWIERDEKFLSDYDSVQLSIIEKFMYGFNRHLDECIKKLGEK